MDTETHDHPSGTMPLPDRAGKRKAQIARWLVALVVVTGLGGVLVARVRSANQAIATQPSLSAIGVTSGQTAPDFTLTPVSGTPAHAIRLGDLRGHVVAINFWSPSCAPCRDEAPVLARAARDYASLGVVFLGVAFDTTSEDITAFTSQYHIPYSCGQDSTNTIAVAYGLLAIPVTVLVDRRGVVVRTIQGAISASSLRQALQSALNRAA
ncbi:MAG: TlpA family protein disulfide reductase [Nitrososphaerota archaeon]